jgi:hypothetical protein
MTKFDDNTVQCLVCGSSRLEESHVDDIPTRRCRQCGELTFDSETTERVRLLLHESPTPTRSVTLDVFDLATA